MVVGGYDYGWISLGKSGGCNYSRKFSWNKTARLWLDPANVWITLTHIHQGGCDNNNFNSENNCHMVVQQVLNYIIIIDDQQINEDHVSNND